MSRSRKHKPFTGLTKSDSEKEDKTLARRRLRRRDKETEEEVHKEEVSDVWTFAKDGRQQFDPDEHPEWMRK